MTAPQGNDGFDVSAAAQAAAKDYPRETKGMTFIDLTAPDGVADAMAWTKRAEPGMPAYEVAALRDITTQANALLRRAPNGERLLAARSQARTRFLGGDMAAEANFAFDHELGHAVTSFLLPLGAERGAQLHQRARWEIQADVFAVLRGINRGTMTREQAYSLSNNRAMRAPGAHATSPALDMLLGDRSDEQIRAMTPQQIADMATSYGEMMAPKQGEIEALARKLDWVRTEAQETQPKADDLRLRERLKKVFSDIRGHSPRSAALPTGQVKVRRLTNEEWLENVADVFNDASSGMLARNTAAHILQSVFTTGKAGYPDEKTFDVSAPKWDKLRRTFSG